MMMQRCLRGGGARPLRRPSGEMNMSRYVVNHLLNKAWQYHRNRACLAFIGMARHNIGVEGRSGTLPPILGLALRILLAVIEWLLGRYFDIRGLVMRRLRA